MKIRIPDALKELATFLDKPIYMVGGFVRNSILFGRQDDTDMDICGALTPEEICTELKGIADIKEINPRIGTVLIIYKGNEFEYTSFRQDSYPLGGQHCPQEVVFVEDMAIDVKRRDFTVNAVYADALTGEVIDLVSGVSDMKKKIIRTVRTPLETFSEDGLRLLRLVRFACELGFSIDEDTENGAKASVDQLLDITGERKREELNRILYSDFKYRISGKPSYAMKLMTKLGLWQNMNFFEPAWKKGAEKNKEFEVLDKAPKSIRLETFAITLLGSPNEKTIDKMFGQFGLRYPKNIVKDIHTAISFVREERDDVELMRFIAKNRNYVESLYELSKIYKVGQNVKELYDEMRKKELPFEYKDLEITDKDFIAYNVKNQNRGKSLNDMIIETYRQRRNLQTSEKREILLRYGEE